MSVALVKKKKSPLLSIAVPGFATHETVFNQVSVPTVKVNIILNKQKAPFSLGERSSISTGNCYFFFLS